VFSAEDGGCSHRGGLALKTLLIRPGAIGDCIVSLPALEHSRTEFTEVWVPSAVKPLIRFADRVESIASTGLDMVEIRAPERTMARLAEFDRIISWYGTRHDEFRAAVRGLPFTFHAALPTGDTRHAVDYFAAQVGAPMGLTPRIAVGHMEQRESIVIHPFSGSAKKYWQIERFCQLATALPAKEEWTAGTEEDLPGALRFADLFELGRWLAGARGYVGNDSGISHLAAAVGTPVVALFRAPNSAVWSPRPSHVRLVSDETRISALFPLFGFAYGGREED